MLLFASSVKANDLAYIEPRWYGNRISTDCHQNLLFTKHDTSGRFLLVTFLEKQNRGRHAEVTCMLGRDFIEVKRSFCEIRVNWILRITLGISLGFWILHHHL